MIRYHVATRNADSTKQRHYSEGTACLVLYIVFKTVIRCIIIKARGGIGTPKSKESKEPD